MPEPIKPVQEPLDVSAVGVIVVGTVLWFVGFLILLPFRSRLATDGHELWMWTCLAGTGLGLLGLPLALRQRANARRARAPRPGSVDHPDPATDGAETDERPF